jgi:hypothetical protein
MFIYSLSTHSMHIIFEIHTQDNYLNMHGGRVEVHIGEAILFLLIENQSNYFSSTSEHAKINLWLTVTNLKAKK